MLTDYPPTVSFLSWMTLNTMRTGRQASGKFNRTLGIGMSRNILLLVRTTNSVLILLLLNPGFSNILLTVFIFRIRHSLQPHQRIDPCGTTASSLMLVSQTIKRFTESCLTHQETLESTAIGNAQIPQASFRQTRTHALKQRSGESSGRRPFSGRI
jgi:hypothetical protein